LNFLLDTNVISETAKPIPDLGVMAWLAAVDEDEVFLSVITLAELRHGVERLPTGARRDQIDNWLTGQLRPRFANRVLSIDAETADIWGRLVAGGQAAGWSISAMDAFIAAVATRHGMTLVTRDAADFQTTGVPLFNPWTIGPVSS